MRFLRSSGTRCLRACQTVDPTSWRVGFQWFCHPGTIGGSDIRVGVLAQDSLNALTKLVQLLLQFVLGVVGFGSHIAYKLIEFVESEVNTGRCPGSATARKRSVNESSAKV
jgi:hypothetical protein